MSRDCHTSDSAARSTAEAVRRCHARARRRPQGSSLASAPSSRAPCLRTASSARCSAKTRRICARGLPTRSIELSEGARDVIRVALGRLRQRTDVLLAVLGHACAHDRDAFLAGKLRSKACRFGSSRDKVSEGRAVSAARWRLGVRWGRARSGSPPGDARCPWGRCRAPGCGTRGRARAHRWSRRLPRGR